MKLPMGWTGKKSKTNPDKKEAHISRKVKRILTHHIEEKDWLTQLKEYNATKPIQK
jgi:hypothetical protein